MMRPALTKIAPQRPTTASSTPAIDGLRSAARSSPPHHAVREHRDEDKHAENAEKSHDRGDTDVAALLGVARIDARALNSDGKRIR